MSRGGGGGGDGPASVSLHGLRVSYGGVRALDGVSLDVAPGEFMVLVGPSGCGKSTLLGALAGLEDLDDGRVVIGGRDVTGLEPAERNVAMVFQSYALYPNMSVARNITFGMRMRGVKREAAAAKLAEVARLLQIEHLLARRPTQLSGGQRQRVAIGRAIVRDPEVFLFDEPLSSLDAKLRAEMRGEIKLLHQRLGATVVYVTHDQVEAMTMASRIAVMRDGRILQAGDPRTVYARPESLFVAEFLGTPGMNLVPGRVVLRGGAIGVDAGGGIVLSLDEYAWVGPGRPEEGRPVVLGIRPEDVSIASNAPDGRGAYAAPMVPMLVEPTGADTLLRLPFAGTEITARVGRDHDVVVGQALPIAINLRNASVFCQDSGRRL